MRGLGHGQVWWADLDKVRPVVVLTRASIADRLHRVLVAPVTTTARSIPVEVPLGADEGMADGSVANLDNTQLVPVSHLVQRAGTIRQDRWSEFCDAMLHTIGCATNRSR